MRYEKRQNMFEFKFYVGEGWDKKTENKKKDKEAKRSNRIGLKVS